MLGALAYRHCSPAPCGCAWLRSCDRSAGHGLPMGSIRGVDVLVWCGPGWVWVDFPAIFGGLIRAAPCTPCDRRPGVPGV